MPRLVALVSSTLVLALGGCAVAAAPEPSAAAPAAAVTSVGLEPAAPGVVDVVAVGVVEGVAESGGTCRFTFWADSGAASRLTGTGAADGGRTRCGPVSEEAGRILPYGRYEVELRYDGVEVSVRSPRIVVELAP